MCMRGLRRPDVAFITRGSTSRLSHNYYLSTARGYEKFFVHAQVMPRHTQIAAVASCMCDMLVRLGYILLV